MDHRQVTLSDEVKQFAREKGAHVVGIASVDRFAEAPRGHGPTDLLPDAQSVVVFGQRFYQTVLDCDTFGLNSELVTDKEDVRNMQRYIWGFMYETINMANQMTAIQVAYLLSERGYHSLPLPASGVAGGATKEFGSHRYALFSHRHAGVLAGLGELGVNNLLLTPEYGPRLRLNSVITTAELAPDPIIMEEICLREDCMLCVEAGGCLSGLHDFEMCGKKMKLARMMGCKVNRCRRLNPEADLPNIRYCIGICPVGKDRG